MNDLMRMRAEIDKIDRRFVTELENRIAAAKKIAEYKIAHGMSVIDRSRERTLLQSRRMMLKDPALREDSDRLFELLMSISRFWQRKIFDKHTRMPENTRCAHGRAAYQGVRGANSHIALLQHFGEAIECIDCDSFEDVFNAVQSGKVAFGMLPIENSYTGSVLPVYDLLKTSELFIIGEKKMKINHMLMGIPGTTLDEIREVYSHEQALMQCTAFLKEHCNWEQRAYFNTAGSAAFVAQQNDKTKAAIANKYAADLYGLEILKQDIQLSRENTTRFIVIARDAYAGKDADKASVSFVLEHKRGILAQTLNLFARYGLDMVKIESRPLSNRPFEYIFYVDFEGEKVRECIDRITVQSGGMFASLHLLGIYRKDCA
jgi:chorismate mutase/prephenate dehydratase